MNIHMMSDFETLGNQPRTAVLSLGLVIANREKILATKEFVFDLSEQIRLGRTVDASTMCWWMSQGESAKKVFNDANNSRYSLKTFGQELQAFLMTHCQPAQLRVWGNGAGFDNVILDHILAQVGVDPGYKFWNHRCYRTLKSMFDIEKGMVRKGTHHNALDDAVFQMECLQKYLQSNPGADR